MRHFHPHRVQRMALYGVALAVILGVMGIGGAGVSRAQNPAGTMAGMAMAAPQASGATIVRLHQRLVRVTIHGLSFGPARLVVSPSTRIVWTNQDPFAHTVSSDKGLWDSGALDSGTHFARVFTTAGTFAYHCNIHPFMHGLVTVKK